jgi:hypothetical protein
LKQFHAVRLTPVFAFPIQGHTVQQYTSDARLLRAISVTARFARAHHRRHQWGGRGRGPVRRRGVRFEGCGRQSKTGCVFSCRVLLFFPHLTSCAANN